MSVVHKKLRSKNLESRAPTGAGREGREPNMVLKVRRLSPDVTLPAYAHPGDAALDLCAYERVELAPGERRLIRTGIAIELPAGTEAQVRPRSGLALKHGFTLLNSPGTIDAGYRGEVGVIAINHGRDPFVVERGMRIAQMAIQRVAQVEVQEAEALSDTARGTGGFGSTGHRPRGGGNTERGT